MAIKGKDTPKSCLGDLEIKKTPQGFLIEKNGNTIELKATEANILKKALISSIQEKDFELLQKLLPGSFLAEKRYHDEDTKLQGKRIIFVSDLPELNATLKSILKTNPLITASYHHYDDKAIFNKDVIDLVVTHHSLPRRNFFLELNQFCLDHHIKFVKSTFDTFKFIITPFLLPHESACYNCYILLKKHNRIFDHDTLEPQDIIHVSNSKPTVLMLQFYAHFLMVTLCKFLTADQFLQEELSEIILDVRKLEILKSPLLKVPFCPACSLHAKTNK